MSPGRANMTTVGPVRPQLWPPFAAAEFEPHAHRAARSDSDHFGAFNELVFRSGGFALERSAIWRAQIPCVGVVAG
jgi:hypothetical protein